MQGVKMNEQSLPFIEREDRCLRVVLIIFTVIQVLLLTALLLPQDPPVLDIPSYPSSSGKVQLPFKSIDAAPKDAKDTNATLPIDRVAPRPTDNNANENEDRDAAEPADNNITTEYEEMNFADSVISSRLSHEVAPKLYDESASSGIGIKPLGRTTTTIDVKEEYDFVPLPSSTRDAKQIKSPSAKVNSAQSDKATTADTGKPVDPAVKADVLRFSRGWKDTNADRYFKYKMTSLAVKSSSTPHRKSSPASDVGGREALPAMNGLALLPLLDRLYSAAQRKRVRTATVAASASALNTAATTSAPQAVAVACAVLLFKDKYFG